MTEHDQAYIMEQANKLMEARTSLLGLPSVPQVVLDIMLKARHEMIAQCEFRHADNRLEMIKIYRAKVGCSLVEAKNAVEAIMAHKGKM